MSKGVQDFKARSASGASRARVGNSAGSKSAYLIRARRLASSSSEWRKLSHDRS
jgi:hypothetical protein